MIRINMFSQADSVAGQGVGAAYLELIRLLRTHLVDDFYVTINKYGRSDLTHYHTINPTYFANSFSPARGRKIGYVHFLPDTLEGSIKLPGVAKKVFYQYVIDFYKRMDQIVVVNPIFIDKLTEYGLDRNKIRYIPNFVAKSEFYEQTQAKKNATRQELGIPQDKFVVFGDGQVQARKGVDDFAKLAEANPDYQFIWAGGFSFGKITDGYDHFKQLVENPPKNLTFTGIIDREKLVDYLNMADLFLLPSFDELFPMSVLEAFSCGTPVLLRDLDLYRAIIDGYYLAGKDSAEMNEQLRFAATHPEVLARQQELSRKASQQYSEDHLDEIWRDFYQEQYQLGRELGQISYE
ncbi:glycosyltransferase family 4 protein [Lactobacillus delbrueckii subsp. lactis]|uniref:glycosyltransferase family 4 protein n=1 Tax=Lactobacillus delbrueckii TaxID=1584 RepID=UPI001E3BB52A|nr:glycosyltransferase family 4 protein [Lactobacillus delbrueckii]MCD5539721.1 glycosyltransferase family 4 protein [Lactobacillus delbrueckii subsp. lactis]MCD5547187.1 glycosyltransferase family 4 protein [Lactobacillus delbrueckii subsp. lactis]MCD5548927.1 glycosyltransferase family 4 protein [Lactobacillus delbrueckii subsp. lactis]MCD5550460.1 glycosyltransferase family 4 protein [Lactobacillus delbrueckii subsp. lactis]MCD5557759.1 glycosyltransferase family 4 protein [Lactobacillus de